MSDIIGKYEPAHDYLHPHMAEVTDMLFAEGLEQEAHELMAISIEYAQRLKYCARLIGHEIVKEVQHD